MRKQLTYNLHSKNLSNTGISRAQTLELIARMYGFNSLSALDHQGLLINWPTELSKQQFMAVQYEGQNTLLTEPMLSETVICFLSSKLSANDIDIQEVAENIQGYLDNEHVKFFRFEDFYDLNLSDKEFELLSNSLLQACDSQNINLLVNVADFFISFINEEDLNHSHWAKELSSGKVLSEPALAFAEAHNFSAECRERAEQLLLTAAEKEQTQAMYALSQPLFNTDGAIWLTKAAECGHPEAIIDLAYQTDPDSGKIGPWTKKAALAGSFDHIVTMAELACKHSTNEHNLEAHVWYELGKLYGFDVTQTEVDNDEDYGPVFVTFEGVYLPKISEEIKIEAKVIAMDWFKSQKEN